jgi:hypothetical protein
VDQKKRGERADRKERRKVQPFRLQVRIIAACHLREVTPKEIADEERLKAATVQYYFGKLEKVGWIHLSRTESVGGGRRHYYVADRLKLITDREFERMNDEQRQETSEGILMHYLGICREALREKTLDSRPDSHLSHTPMDLDLQGWRDLQSELDRLLERSLEIKIESMMRLRKSGEEGIPTLVHLGGFEVPASVTAGIKTQA